MEVLGSEQRVQHVRRHGKHAVLGLQTVHVPAGTFKALAVRITRAAGLPIRQRDTHVLVRSGLGLVKLVFKHGDNSVSTVVLLH